MNATGRENDDFAVTWSISPSIAELMPLVMDTAYNGSITTENDYFCAPVSGQGYIDAGNFYNAGTEYMNTFLGNLDTYLKRSDLSVTTIIGAENYSGGIYGTLNAYAGVESLEGGLGAPRQQVLWRRLFGRRILEERKAVHCSPRFAVEHHACLHRGEDQHVFRYGYGSRPHEHRRVFRHQRASLVAQL